MQDILKRILFSFVFIGMLVSVLVAVKYSIPQYRTWQENRALRAQLQTQVDAQRQSISTLRRKVDRFYSSRWFVEQLARANHRVAENEIVFVFD